MYISAKDQALKAFIGVLWPDIVILDCLNRDSKPFNYQALHHQVGMYGNVFALQTFATALKRQVDRGCIIRERIGKNVTYSITLEGRRLLLDFNQVLERVVKERVMRQGNGVINE